MRLRSGQFSSIWISSLTQFPLLKRLPFSTALPDKHQYKAAHGLHVALSVDPIHFVGQTFIIFLARAMFQYQYSWIPARDSGSCQLQPVLPPCLAVSVQHLQPSMCQFPQEASHRWAGSPSSLGRTNTFTTWSLRNGALDMVLIC